MTITLMDLEAGNIVEWVHGYGPGSQTRQIKVIERTTPTRIYIKRGGEELAFKRTPPSAGNQIGKRAPGQFSFVRVDVSNPLGKVVDDGRLKQNSRPA